MPGAYRVESARQALAALLAQHRSAIVDDATDWVIAEAVDLRGRRPREETRRLVERVVAWNEALLLCGDEGPLNEFIELVTSFRAASEFQISTLLRGFGSFRAAVAEWLTPPRVDGEQAFAVLRLVDEAYCAAIFRMSDQYVAKLNQTVQDRRQQLEQELALLTEQRMRELDQTLSVINAQADLLRSLSLPIIRIFESVLVLPLIGEFSAERSTDLLYRLLEAIVAQRARVVILDVTGLHTADAAAVAALFKATQAARLLGSVAMIVGLSKETAVMMAGHYAGAGTLRVYASLSEGLRAAMEMLGFLVIRRSRGDTQP